MGVDYRMIQTTEAFSNGLNPRLSLNWTAVELVVDLLKAKGASGRDLDLEAAAAKLTSNEGLLVTSAECELLFGVARQVSSDLEDGLMVEVSQLNETSFDSGEPAVRELVERLASFCRDSALFGGFEVT